MATGYLLFSLITSEILLLINFRRSTLLSEILDLALNIDSTTCRGDIQTGSHDDIRTDFSGTHLSINVLILSSIIPTATLISSAVITSPKSSAANDR